MFEGFFSLVRNSLVTDSGGQWAELILKVSFANHKSNNNNNKINPYFTNHPFAN